jgi:hypothetical protein
MYPVDVYDIHLYSDAPWTQSARWATGLALPKPWFAGEAGCATGNVTCTYDGTAGLPVDQWWLANMTTDGARAVLVEDRGTAWTYTRTGTGQVPTLSRVGRFIAATDAMSQIATATSMPSMTPIHTSAPTAKPTPRTATASPTAPSRCPRPTAL